jgi:hypothetical protein
MYLDFRFELFFGARILAQMRSLNVGEIDPMNFSTQNYLTLNVCVLTIKIVI